MNHAWTMGIEENHAMHLKPLPDTLTHQPSPHPIMEERAIELWISLIFYVLLLACNLVDQMDTGQKEICYKKFQYAGCRYKHLRIFPQ